MSVILSYVFKTNLAGLRTAILDDNTDKICRILDVERNYLNRVIDGDGNTALLLAIENASPLTVRLLLEHGAHPDKPNAVTYQTPLGLIASMAYEDFYSYKAQHTLEMAKILLSYGAYVDKPSLRIYRDENDVDYFGKETPLMTAVRKQNVPLVTLLITKNANVNALERQSQIRPIHFAITNGDEIMYDLLEKSGALINSVLTNGGNTLLHWFCYKKENDKNSSLLQKLIDKGCNINAQNRENLTPLMIAAKHNMIDTCRLLLQNHADMDEHDLDGKQAIDFTMPGSECSKLLRQAKNTGIISPLNNGILWRKRIDSKRHVVSEINGDTFSPQEEVDLTNTYLRYSSQKRYSEQCHHKHENIWNKFLQTSPKRKGVKTLYDKRAHSVETQNRANH